MTKANHLYQTIMDCEAEDVHEAIGMLPMRRNATLALIANYVLTSRLNEMAILPLLEAAEEEINKKHAVAKKNAH